MKREMNLSIRIILAVFAGLGSLPAYAQVVPPIQCPPGFEESFRKPSPADLQQLSQWQVKSRVLLKDLLAETDYVEPQDARQKLLDGMAAISQSDGYRPELLMRYVLNRGLKIVAEIDKEADNTEPGVVDEEVAVLRQSIHFALDDHLDEVKALSSDGASDSQLPYAAFGLQYAAFLMSIDRSIFDASAQYNVAYIALGLLQWDLYRQTDHLYDPAITRIYETLNQMPQQANSIDSKAIDDLRKLRAAYKRAMTALQTNGVTLPVESTPAESQPQAAPVSPDAQPQVQTGEILPTNLPEDKNTISIGIADSSQTNEIGLNSDFDYVFAVNFHGFGKAYSQLRFFAIRGEVSRSTNDPNGYDSAYVEIVPTHYTIPQDYKTGTPQYDFQALPTSYTRDLKLGIDEIISMKLVGVTISGHFKDQYSDKPYPVYASIAAQALGAQLWSEAKGDSPKLSWDYGSLSGEGGFEVGPANVFAQYSRDLGDGIQNERASGGVRLNAPHGFRITAQYDALERDKPHRASDEPDVKLYRRARIFIQKTF